MISIPSFFIASNDNTTLKLNGLSYPGKCVHDVLGAKVEVNAKWWPPCSSIRTLVVFVPGNPGVIEFYDLFLDSLYARYKERGLAILAHGMLGHAPQLSIPRYTGLIHQVESLVQVLTKIRQEWTKIRVVVICHSVGAWVTTQSLKLGADIDAIFGLFPVLSNLALSPRGKQLSWLFQDPFPYIIVILVVILRPIAPFLIRLLFNAWPKQQQEVLLSIARSPGVVLSCLSMARDEIETIKMPDESFLRQYSAILWLYYGIRDHWVGVERERIVNMLEDSGKLRIVHCRHGIPHDFCILHGQLLAAQCGAWLEGGDLI